MKPELKGKDRVSVALSELWESTRKDLTGAWNDRLRAAWQEEVDRSLRGRLGDLSTRLQQAVQFDLGWRLAAEVDAATPGLKLAGRTEAIREFHTVVRQLTSHETEDHWHAALVEGAARFARQPLLLAVRGGYLLGPGDLAVDLGDAPAFSSAIESRDTVAALRRAGELSEDIVAALGESSATRCFLVPVVVRESVRAVLCADDDADLNALEALAAIAAAAAAARVLPQPQLVVLESPAPALVEEPAFLDAERAPAEEAPALVEEEPSSLEPQPWAEDLEPPAEEPEPEPEPYPLEPGADSGEDVLPADPDLEEPQPLGAAPEPFEETPAKAEAEAEAEPVAEPEPEPAPELQPLDETPEPQEWIELPAPPPRPAPLVLRSFREEQALQFARVSVAQILLLQPDRVRAGRQQRDLYGMLREEIESAREQYGQRFAGASDYLHDELVQTLAAGDAGCLGEDYPDPDA